MLLFASRRGCQSVLSDTGLPGVARLNLSTRSVAPFCLSLLLLLTTSLCTANDKQVKTTVLNNDHKLSLHQVMGGIYAISGPLGNRSKNNLGNNATFGFIVTDDGIVLIDPGGTHKGAIRIHKLIKTISDKPIRYVINTGGQDHRWLGNEYYQKLGARVIASSAAVADQKQRINDILLVLEDTAGDEALTGTNDSYADITFEKKYEFRLAGITFELHHVGGAHSPGDAFVWLPKQKVVFSGDIIYTERMLSMMSFSNSKGWVKAYKAVAALEPNHIIPGHGKPTTLSITDRDTYNYLTSLRKEVTQFMDNGGAIEDVSTIDQSQFSYLENYDSLKGRNVQKIYQEIEFE